MTNLTALLAAATSFVSESSTSHVSASDKHAAVNAIVRAHSDESLIEFDADLSQEIMSDVFEECELDREAEYNEGDWMDDSRY